MKYKVEIKDRTRRRSKTQLTQGAFGKQSLPLYRTLRVLNRSKRTPLNCNSCGVQTTNAFIREQEEKNNVVQKLHNSIS